jgi:hypothetical protein
MIGFDYSAGRIAPAALLAARCGVVFRYVSTPGNPKNIAAAELAELVAAGIGVGLVYETSADWMLGGYNAGVAAARSARAQATAAGYGPGCRLWFAADFDATPAQVAVILDCLHGCADAEGSPTRVALYGGLHAIKAAADAGFGAPWQTVAWSGGVWDPRAVIRQTGKQQVIGGVSVDVNELTTADLGQWTGADEMTEAQAALLQQIYNAVFFGGTSMGPIPTGQPNNSLVSQLADLRAHLATQTTELTAIEGEWKTAEPVAIDSTALVAALKDPTVLAAIASAVLAAQGAADTAAATAG